MNFKIKEVFLVAIFFIVILFGFLYNTIYISDSNLHSYITCLSVKNKGSIDYTKGALIFQLFVSLIYNYAPCWISNNIVVMISLLLYALVVFNVIKRIIQDDIYIIALSFLIIAISRDFLYGTINHILGLSFLTMLLILYDELKDWRISFAGPFLLFIHPLDMVAFSFLMLYVGEDKKAKFIPLTLALISIFPYLITYLSANNYSITSNTESPVLFYIFRNIWHLLSGGLYFFSHFSFIFPFVTSAILIDKKLLKEKYFVIGLIFYILNLILPQAIVTYYDTNSRFLAIGDVFVFSFLWKYRHYRPYIIILTFLIITSAILPHYLDYQNGTLIISQKNPDKEEVLHVFNHLIKFKNAYIFGSTSIIYKEPYMDKFLEQNITPVFSYCDKYRAIHVENCLFYNYIIEEEKFVFKNGWSISNEYRDKIKIELINRYGTNGTYIYVGKIDISKYINASCTKVKNTFICEFKR